MPHEAPQLPAPVDGVPFAQHQLKVVCLRRVAPIEHRLGVDVVRYEIGGLQEEVDLRRGRAFQGRRGEEDP